MDSMVGYKNGKYLYFGRAAAKLDDVMNYVPSRISGLLMVASSAFTSGNAKGAWRIFRRDRYNHASPNSAQTEAACAGALGLQLAGDAWYFGERYHKPTIGDPMRDIEDADIIRANCLMYLSLIHISMMVWAVFPFRAAVMNFLFRQRHRCFLWSMAGG